MPRSPIYLSIVVAVSNSCCARANVKSEAITVYYIYVARVIATYVTFYHRMTAYKCSFVAAY